MELAALARGRAHPDAAAVALDDFLADGEPDAGARILAHGVQPLEEHEDALEVLRLDADAVVGHRDAPLARLLRRRDVDARHGAATELERVAHQVLEELRELHLVRLDGGQAVPRDGGAGFADRGMQVGDRALKRRLDGYRLELLALGA